MIIVIKGAGKAETTFNLIAYFLVLAAVILSILSLWRRQDTDLDSHSHSHSHSHPDLDPHPDPHSHSHLGRGLWEKGSFLLMAAAFLSISAGLAARSLAIGRLPFATLYEFTFLFIWGILLFYLLTRRWVRSGMLTALTGLLVFVLISYGGTLPNEARPLMPALQSYWLQIHVFTAIIAYGAFALSFCFGVLYLVKEKLEPKEKAGILPSLARLDQLNHRAVVIGFPFLSFLIITGAIWADEVWGSWWSWDPKETWALITWLVYAAFLHARKTYSLRGRQAAIIAVLGFLLVLFTLFGVSFLLPGLHSYI